MDKISLNVEVYDRKYLLNKKSITQIEDTLNKFIDAGLWHFKGVVDTVEELYLIPNPEVGDVYHVRENLSEWAYTKEGWVELGSIIDLSEYAKIVDVSNALNLKADKVTTYTKDETNTLLVNKANVEDIPTKTSQLTNDSSFITLAVVDNKADKATTIAGYGIEDVSLLINGKLQIGGRSMFVQPKLSNDINAGNNISISNDLKISATVPTKTSQLTNDSSFIDGLNGVKHVWKGTEAELPETRQDDTLYIII